MKRLARHLAFGLLAGALLSAMRAPSGLDLVHLSMPGARDAALFRAAALLALVLPLDSTRRAFRAGVGALPLLLGACAGFAVHGLFLAARYEPQTRGGFALLFLCATIGLFLCAGGRSGPAPDAAPALSERLGLLLVGLGLGLAFEHLARYARLFGVGLPEDDTVLGGVLLAGSAFGALSFGPLVARSTSHGRLVAGLGALSVASTLVGLRFADHLEQDPARDPLHAYLQRFGLDVTLVGTLTMTALLAAAIFVVPAFGLGATLSAARDARRFATLVMGAALGTLFVPWVMESLSVAVPAAELSSSTWSFGPWAAALACAVLGAFAALLGAPPGGARTVARAATALALAVLVLGPRLAVWPFSPWYIVPIAPELAVPAAEGLFTVERERGGARIVTLDRKLLTPTAAKEEVDARRIEWSWGLLPADVRAADPRVLFVGQMTPVRARTFAALGALRLERTVPWHAAADAIEELLFDGEGAPPGARIGPAEASARLRSGSYDLVIVAPVQGPLLRPKSAYVLPWGAAAAPATAGLEVPDGTLAVAWIDAGAPLVGRTLGERVVLAAKHFDDLTLGLVLGTRPLAPEGERVPLLATGDARARPSGWALSRRRADQRARGQYAALCARLRDANEGTEHADLTSGLAVHYGAQVTSSPFEDYAAQIELVEDELRSFARAAERRLDPFLRATWDDLAVLLSEKRMVDLSLVYLEPLAQRYAPWPTLERAMAYAYSEFGMHAEALALLDGVLEREPYQIDLLLECARLAREGTDGRRALAYLERALAIQPGHLQVEIEHAATLLELGDPRGRERLEELRRLHPEEQGIETYLGEEPTRDPED